MVAIEGVFTGPFRNRIRPTGPLPPFFFVLPPTGRKFRNDLIFKRHLIDLHHLIDFSDLQKDGPNLLFPKKKTSLGLTRSCLLHRVGNRVKKWGKVGGMSLASPSLFATPRFH